MLYGMMKEKIWSMDEYDVQRLIDESLIKYKENKNISNISVKLLDYFEIGVYYITHMTTHLLDNNIVFADQETTKKDYVTKKITIQTRKYKYRCI